MKRAIAILLSVVCACLTTGASWHNILSGSTPSAASFNPQTQGTLVNWYDASTLGLSNGANIVTWTDSKTGNPNPLTTTGFNPTYATNQQNGLSAASFAAASSQSMTTGGSSASTLPYTLAMVVKVNSLASSRVLMVGSGTTGLLLYLGTDGKMRLYSAASPGINVTASTAISTGAYHLLVVTVSTTGYAFYIDGAAAGSASGTYSLSGTTTWRLGYNSSGVSYLDGYIGEVQIYSSVLGSGDLSGLYSYIVGKWVTP